jgi:SAM-dependent methyltransferase
MFYEETLNKNNLLQFLPVNYYLCPLCQSDSKFVFKAMGYSIRECKRCNHRFVEIQIDSNYLNEVYNDSYFNGGGTGYTDYFQENKILLNRGRSYARKIFQLTSRKGKVLDVGSAAGFILKGFIDEGWTGIGIEPNLKMVKAGQQNLGLDIRQNSLENFSTVEKFDLITMIQVVAHFYLPVKAIQNAADLLKDDGLLLIETWNRNSFLAKIFGKQWHEYSPPSVLHYFSFKGLNEFLIKFGFIKIADGYPRKRISGTHAKSILRYHIGNNFLLKLIPDKMSLIYPSEDLFWVLYQKKYEKLG